MLKLFKDTIKITNDNIILATPLILFMWISSMYIAFSKGAANSAPLMLLSFITLLFMTSAFLAGWFYMVKKAINLSKQVFVLDSDRAKATFNLLKSLSIGIGKYFLSFLGQTAFSFVIFAITGLLIFKLGSVLIGDIGIDPTELKTVLASTTEMKTFLDSLTLEQLIKLNNWNLLILGFTSLLSFLSMLWIPEIIYNTINPFKALFKSIAKIFKKPLNAIKLYIFITIINFVLSLLNALSMLNPILYFVIMILYFYFLVYLVVLIFNYYDNEFREE